MTRRSAVTFRSLDRAIDAALAQGLRSGIEQERQRIRDIVQLPEAHGLERAAVAAALAGLSLNEARECLGALQKIHEPVQPPSVAAFLN